MEWKIIANNFNDNWNFPNCVGTFDRKHVVLHSETEYFNSKRFFSIFLFVNVITKYKFILRLQLQEE